MINPVYVQTVIISSKTTSMINTVLYFNLRSHTCHPTTSTHIETNASSIFANRYIAIIINMPTAIMSCRYFKGLPRSNIRNRSLAPMDFPALTGRFCLGDVMQCSFILPSHSTIGLRPNRGGCCEPQLQQRLPSNHLHEKLKIRAW